MPVAAAAAAADTLRQAEMRCFWYLAAMVAQAQTAASAERRQTMQAAAEVDTATAAAKARIPEALAVRAAVGAEQAMALHRSQARQIRAAAAAALPLNQVYTTTLPQAAPASSSSATSDHPAQSVARSRSLALIRSTHSRHLARSR